MNHGFFNTTQKVSTNPCTGRAPVHQRQKKARQSKSKFKALMIVFFDIRGIVHVDWVPEGQTVNQVYYKEILTNLCEWVRRIRPEMWKNGSWVLHQTTCRHVTPVCQDVFDEAQDHRVGTSTVLT